MDETTRRSILGVTGTALLAGCGGSGNESDDQTPDAADESTPTDRPDRDDDGVPDGEDEFPDDPDLSRVTDEVDDTRQLEEDEWYWYQYEFSSVGEISYDFVVRDGPEIDVYLFSEEEYSAFENDERARVFTDGSVEDSTGGRTSLKLDPGTYRLVFDNTNFGATEPPTNFSNDVIEVEHEIVVAE